MKLSNAGSAQPKLCLAKGINLVIDCKSIFGAAEPNTSGILNKNVTKTTILKTFLEANLSGITFSKIKTIVIG